jgi:putative transposase
VLARQCELAGVNRSTVYAPHLAAKPDEQELTLLELIDAEYTRHPFYGSRKIKIYLRGLGHKLNRKRVQRLMGIWALPAWHRGRIPAVRTRSTRSIRTCSGA